MLNGYQPLFMYMNAGKSTTIIAYSYINVAVLRREEEWRRDE